MTLPSAILAVALLSEAALSGAPRLSVLEPELVRTLEGAGLGLSERLTGSPARSTEELPRGHGYETVVRTLSRDLARHSQRDPRAGVGPRFIHRLFDVDWLRDSHTRFELVGVVNRLDRQPFSRERCGETRLVYRLSYTTDAGLYSRLPMTINLVYWQAGETCAEVARRWLSPTGGGEDERWLRAPAGPLSDARLDRALLKSLEVNVQSVRWPSTVHPTLGGHAEYILRVFEPAGRGLAVAKLENTPDSALLRRKKRLRKQLLAWLRVPGNLQRIDDGTALIPKHFLAEKAVSVTPRGLGRLANRPFASLFSERELAGLPLEGRTHIGSPKALLRRLDGRTCVGCHQSRSIAGFHLPGEDPAHQSLDALAYGRSPHFESEIVRREAFTRAWLDGTPPDPRRGPAERVGSDGRHGAHCGLGDPGFASWTCTSGFTCRAVDDPDVGTCVTTAGPAVGEPCEPGTLHSRRVGHHDRIRFETDVPCAVGQVCEGTSVGFPGGMCATSCSAEDPDAICGAIALLTPFNRCVGKGQPFTHCLARHTRPAGLRRCSPDVPCRDDYVCARVQGEVGACLPPYFLFQMRVDGH